MPLRVDSRRSIAVLWVLLVLVLGARLLAMALLPLADTSEPRYAEMGRIMAETGDWITPYFDYGVPFWGKPPLAFWAEALAIRCFGVSEFSVRLPAFLATLGILGLVYALARTWMQRRGALLACLLLASSALGYIAAGAVLTDPFLVLGTTLALTGFVRSWHGGHALWRYGPFVGAAIGLLAKGPLALVLIGMPVLVWTIWQGNYREVWQRLPWWRGAALTAALALPWYLLAEAKTPGFLRYFIVGEHFSRFVDAGWSGDRYGHAHAEPLGTIWGYWLLATLPWAPLALLWLARTASAAAGRRALRAAALQPWTGFLLLWMLWPLVFFTLAGNIIWTYALPALPPFAVLLAQALTRGDAYSAVRRAHWGALLVPVAVLGYALYGAVAVDSIKSEKSLVESYRSLAGRGEPLLYVDKRPFSAQFYSAGSARRVSAQAAQTLLGHSAGTVFLAVPSAQVAPLRQRLGLPLQPLDENRRYQLFEVAADKATALTTTAGVPAGPHSLIH